MDRRQAYRLTIAVPWLKDQAVFGTRGPKVHVHHVVGLSAVPCVSGALQTLPRGSSDGAEGTMSPAAVRIEFSCTAYASARTKSAGVIFAKRSRRDLAALGAEDSHGILDRREHRRMGTVVVP